MPRETVRAVNNMRILSVLILVAFLSACHPGVEIKKSAKLAPEWKVDFFDDFDTFNTDNWQDQILWVNNEDQCYVRNNAHNTREVSNGTLKIRVIDVGVKVDCDNVDKFGKLHPPTQYVAGRIASKNRKEFTKGKWTARLRVPNSGQSGMFPAWWLLGVQNNEPPVQEKDETVCWPLKGSGEIDIFEHHSDGGPNHYAARVIKSLGRCDGGDWESMMQVNDADLNEFHEYSVEWLDGHLVYRLDGNEFYRNDNYGDTLSEPLFAILNFAKINDSKMTSNWVMEVDWVKHEYLKQNQ